MRKKIGLSLAVDNGEYIVLFLLIDITIILDEGEGVDTAYFHLMIIVKAHSPQTTAPPVPMEVSLPVAFVDKQPVAYNYVDCTETNEEEEDDGDENEDAELEDEGQQAIKEKEDNKDAGKNQIEAAGHDSSKLPRWEDFFTAETLPDSQNSINSQSGCSAPSPCASRLMGSQTPDLFSDEEFPNTDENFSLTLSASLSNHSSQNLESCLPDTLILQPEQGERGQGDLRARHMSQEKGSNDQNIQSNTDELPDSQTSSEFDIPSTPESKVPRADDLLQMYQRLAAGEELVIIKGPQ